MVNIVIYSNCQGDVIKKLLSEKLVGNYHHIQHYLFFKKPEKLPKSILIAADIFIFQFTNKSHGICSTDENSKKNIFSFLKKDCIKIGIPSIFQSSFWPIIPGPAESLIHYDHCRDGYEIIKELKHQKTLNEIFKLFDENKIDFKLKERFHKCEEHTREIENYYLHNTELTIIPITNFIRDNYKEYRLFMSHCHPTIYIFLYIVNGIIKFINKEFYKKDKIMCFENIFKYKYDYKINHLKPGGDWCDSKYIIKELGVKYITNTNEKVIKIIISLAFPFL